MFPKIGRTYRHIQRYRQILGILLKYGFSEVVDIVRKDLVGRFGNKIIPLLGKGVDTSMSRAERLRFAAEELGPAFVKLGQILSMRYDIVPADIGNELQKLQDEVTPFPFEQVQNIIEQELHQNPDDIFKSLDVEPIAAASIAQVHRATLLAGEQVVLKVQRPEIRAIIDVDLEILADLAVILERHSKNTVISNPTAIVAEFNRSIHRELDFLSEGRNIQRFGRLFVDDPTVHIPTIYPNVSTSRLLVMDYIDGVKASNLEEIESLGLDSTIIALRGTQFILRQIFEFGFFHADPHPGNIMVLDDNIIAPLDYGMVGILDESTIDELGNLLTGVVHKDIRRIVKALNFLGIAKNIKDNNVLQADLSDFIGRYYEIPLKQLQVSMLLKEIFEIARIHQMVIPANLSLMLKALVTIEGLGRTLYPDFDMVSEVRPYIKRIMLRRYDPRRKIRRLSVLLDDFYRLFEEFPYGLRGILDKLERGELKVRFEHHNLENIAKEFNRSSNRISAALIIASLIIGSSLVLQVSMGPNLFGFPLLGIAGYLLASILGLILLWSIFRSKE